MVKKKSCSSRAPVVLDSNSTVVVSIVFSARKTMLNASVLEPPSTLPCHVILGRCSRFLMSHDDTGLETKVCLEVLSELTDQTLEWQFADQKPIGLLVMVDPTESNGTGTIPMGFLDSSGGWCRFAVRRPGAYPITHNW